jgi:hypothetical protein
MTLAPTGTDSAIQAPPPWLHRRRESRGVRARLSNDLTGVYETRGSPHYSDAHLFPVAYNAKGVGRTLGMPVPGTGTFVWRENQFDPTLLFGIPMGGWRGQDGKFCENTRFEPDIRVRNEPDVLTTGRDQQLEAAVRELLK